MSTPVVLIADLFPGSVLVTEIGKRPDGVPASAKLHVVVTTTQIAIAWELGSYGGGPQVGELFLDVSEFDNSDLSHNGGVVGPYTVARAGGCSCGRALKRWNPYAGQQVTQLVRASSGQSSYGIPQKYTRS